MIQAQYSLKEYQKQINNIKIPIWETIRESITDVRQSQHECIIMKARVQQLQYFINNAPIYEKICGIQVRIKVDTTDIIKIADDLYDKLLNKEQVLKEIISRKLYNRPDNNELVPLVPSDKKLPSMIIHIIMQYQDYQAQNYWLLSKKMCGFSSIPRFILFPIYVIRKPAIKTLNMISNTDAQSNRVTVKLRDNLPDTTNFKHNCGLLVITDTTGSQPSQFMFNKHWLNHLHRYNVDIKGAFFNVCGKISLIYKDEVIKTIRNQYTQEYQDEIGFAFKLGINLYTNMNYNSQLSKDQSIKHYYQKKWITEEEYQYFNKQLKLKKDKVRKMIKK